MKWRSIKCSCGLIAGYAPETDWSNDMPHTNDLGAAQFLCEPNPLATMPMAEMQDDIRAEAFFREFLDGIPADKRQWFSLRKDRKANPIKRTITFKDEWICTIEKGLVASSIAYAVREIFHWPEPKVEFVDAFADGAWVRKTGGDYEAIGQIVGGPMDLGDGVQRFNMAIKQITKGRLLHIVNPKSLVPSKPIPDPVPHLRSERARLDRELFYAKKKLDWALNALKDIESGRTPRNAAAAGAKTALLVIQGIEVDEKESS